jgi:hypothetical protein
VRPFPRWFWNGILPENEQCAESGQYQGFHDVHSMRLMTGGDKCDGVKRPATPISHCPGTNAARFRSS